MNNTQPQFFLLNCTLSLGTIPVLGLIMAMEHGQQWFGTTAKGPEEIFRGDRLPLLPFPKTRSSNNING